MSAKASGRVWDLDLPHNKRLVLLAMADHADHDGRNIYPSTDLIAWKTGYSSRQVQRVIDTLITDGILVVVKPARQQHPATYSINFAAGITKPPFDRVTHKAQGRQNVTSEGRQNVTPEKSRGDILAHPGVTFEPSRGDIAMSPEPWEPLEPPPPPATTTAEPSQGGGGGFDREIAKLFTSYHITQAEPLARLYRDAFPDVTLEQLRAACVRLDDPTAGQHRGSRLYRVLKLGLPDDVPKQSRPAIPAPTRIERPPDVLSPIDAARVLTEMRKKHEETRHARTAPEPGG